MMIECFFGCDLNTPGDKVKATSSLPFSLLERGACLQERIPWQDQIFSPLLQWRQSSQLFSRFYNLHESTRWQSTRQMSSSTPQAASSAYLFFHFTLKQVVKRRKKQGKSRRGGVPIKKTQRKKADSAKNRAITHPSTMSTVDKQQRFLVVGSISAGVFLNGKRERETTGKSVCDWQFLQHLVYAWSLTLMV